MYERLFNIPMFQAAVPSLQTLKNENHWLSESDSLYRDFFGIPLVSKITHFRVTRGPPP